MSIKSDENVKCKRWKQVSVDLQAHRSSAGSNRSTCPVWSLYTLITLTVLVLGQSNSTTRFDFRLLKSTCHIRAYKCTQAKVPKSLNLSKPPNLGIRIYYSRQLLWANMLSNNTHIPLGKSKELTADPRNGTVRLSLLESSVNSCLFQDHQFKQLHINQLISRCKKNQAEDTSCHCQLR